MKVPSGAHVLIGLAIGVVVVAVVSGLIVLGPPSEQRARRLDERRVEDLRGITRAVDLYWTRHGRLPTSLDELLRESGVNINSNDPSTTQLYDYRVLGDKTYELCAHFQRDSPEPSQPVSKPKERAVISLDDLDSLPVPATPPDKGFWSHGAGRQCFQPEVEEVLR
ncbi:MAG: hypothetical protein ACE5JX_02645 [Acidobacteriota bacterium]